MRSAARLTIVLACLALLACREGGSGPGGFARDLTRICDRANGTLRRLPAPSPGPAGSPGPDAVAFFLRSSATVTGDAARAVGALRVPRDLIATRDAVVGALDAARDALVAAGDAAARDDEAAVVAAREALEAARTRLGALARDIGAPACVPGGTMSPSAS